jgi:hypothetical protein
MKPHLIFILSRPCPGSTTPANTPLSGQKKPYVEAANSVSPEVRWTTRGSSSGPCLSPPALNVAANRESLVGAKLAAGRPEGVACKLGVSRDAKHSFNLGSQPIA